jgi:hypothetical protein
MGLDVRPSIAVTKAHMKMSEIDEVSRKGGIEVDGKVVLKSRPVLNADGSISAWIQGWRSTWARRLWTLSGICLVSRNGLTCQLSFGFLEDWHRLKVSLSSESLLRRALFEDTGGMYPELITRPDIKVFLPPIGNLTVYICMLPQHLPFTLTASSRGSWPTCISL